MQMKKKYRHLLDGGRFYKRAGQIPGELKNQESNSGTSVVNLMNLSGENIETKRLDTPDQIEKYAGNIFWLDVNGLADMDMMKEIGNQFNLHSLVLEDILNEGHLPKFEFSKDYKLFICKLPVPNPGKNEFNLIHVGIVLKDKAVITFQESSFNGLYPILGRLKSLPDSKAQSNPEYLFYWIIDFIIDQYFLVMEDLRNSIESREDILMEEPGENQIHEIQRIKKQIVIFRKNVNFLKAALNKLLSKEVSFRDESVKNFFSDVYDHIVHVSEMLETAKDMQVALLELNISNVNNSMNRVMKTLTIVATIFIPLTFIAGIYGMNFEYMPELKWEWGYPAILIFMLILAVYMVWVIRRKGWF